MNFRALFCLVLLCAALSLRAQTWEKIGPNGLRTLLQVAESDSALVMLCDAGATTAVTELYRSEDKGHTWQRVDFPYNKMTDRLSAVACIKNVFFAMTYHSDFCMSLDHGKTWTVRLDIVDHQSSFATPTMLDIADQVFVPWGNKFYNTNDSGALWYYEKAPLDDDIVRTVYTNNNIIAVTRGGVYRSDDRAGSWKNITPNFVEDDYNERDLAVVGNTIYVSTYRRVYYTSNMGASWSVSDIFPLTTTYIRLASYASRLWVAHGELLSYTSDNFASLHSVSVPDNHRYTNIITSAGNALYLSAYEGGGYISHDSAKSWSFIENGLPPRGMANLWANNDVLLAGTSGGTLMRSTNEGSLWERAFQSTTIAAGSNQFSAICKIGDTLVTVIDEDHLVMRSGDGGVTWVTNNKPAPWYEIYDIAGNNTVWVAVVKRNGSAYRSTDRGGSWSVIDGQEFVKDNFRMLALHDTSFFAASPSGGIWRSNADATKFEKQEGVGLPLGSCYSVASNGRTLLAGFYGDLYRSRDSGASWQKIDFPFVDEVWDIKMSGPNVVILNRTSVNNMVYFSPNECDTIISLSPGGFTSRDSWEAAINNKYLFIQSKDKGIFRYNYLPLASVSSSREQQQFTLYPNPARSVLNIEATDKPNATVHLMDMLGREVRSGKLSEEGKLTLEVRELPNGIYTIMLEHNGTTSLTEKIVVAK